MTITAGDHIKAMLRLIGVLAEGEPLGPDMGQDALSAVNQMLDSWSTERLAVFSTQTQVFTWAANQASQTIGATGNFVGNRPVTLDDSTYFVDPTTGVSYNIRILNQSDYNDIAVKTVTSTYPQVIWLNADYPNSTLTVYPVPSRALEWHIVSVQELTQIATLSTVLAFPPGYLRAFKYNGAIEIAAEFGVEPSKTVERIAMTSKRNLKRINNPDDLMSMPRTILKSPGRYNIFAGNY